MISFLLQEGELVRILCHCWFVVSEKCMRESRQIKASAEEGTELLEWAHTDIMTGEVQNWAGKKAQWHITWRLKNALGFWLTTQYYYEINNSHTGKWCAHSHWDYVQQRNTFVSVKWCRCIILSTVWNALIGLSVYQRVCLCVRL